MTIRQMLDRGISAGPRLRRHTPWIAGPLAGPEHAQSPTDHVVSPSSDANTNRNIASQKAKLPPFKHRHESSTIELFYDLFFVANLSSFTNNHEIVDSKTLRNYIGYFTLLWFTWLQTSLFDVRFASDSFFDRVCKAISFGVMTGFAMVGVLYDTTNIEHNARAFQAMSLILMTSRIVLMLQYAVVMLYLRGYQNTRIPLLATMLTLFVAAIVFLGTYWGFTVAHTIDHAGNEGEKLAHPDTFLGWYVVVVVEAVAVIAISCTWRVVSFKRTHLVERVGLLTLIMMGEGILGMTQSVSQVLWNVKGVYGSDLGVIISSVLLIYFIWVLYFDQIEHDRFGTIRQQIWAMLHFPLHVAILLTVEGASALILWNVIQRYVNAWFDSVNFALENLNSTQGIVTYLSNEIQRIDSWNKETSLAQFYNYQNNLTTLSQVTAPFNSTDWQNEAMPILSDLILGVFNAVFEQFGIEGPESHNTAHPSLEGKSDSLINVFATVFIYFYIAAGCFLMVLAIMYWFGKTKKSLGEWLSVLLRILMGIGLALFCLFSFYSTPAAQNFASSYWPVPIVIVAYFIVIVLDNILVWHMNKSVAKHISQPTPATIQSHNPQEKAPAPDIEALSSSDHH